MELEVKEKFIKLWNKYFPNSELPLVFYYTDDPVHAEPSEESTEWRCLIADLIAVRKGSSVYFDGNSIGCGGGRRYLGFDLEPGPDLEYFLSCGIPGKVEGIRYKKSPELVNEQSRLHPPFEAPRRYIVFKRWDMLDESDRPVAVIFFAVPDVLSGLFSLANFDEAITNAVITPSGSGCSAIVYYPYMESLSDHPRSVIGMFDISARPYVPASTLTFSTPWAKFISMVENMDESFLITDGWDRIKSRTGRL